MTVAIRLDGVSKRFERDAVLQGVDLAVAPSEIVALVGPSGCGKSTLLRLIAGLERGHAGRVTVDGRDVVGPSPAVGFMFQEPRLMPWLSVRDNVLLGLPRAPRRDGDALVATLLAQVHLPASAHALPRQLSGGMAQRVALARALATAPRALLLDEPFSAVDALTRMALQELVLAVWQRTRPTLVLVTHDLDEALHLADRIVVMAGRPATLDARFAIALPRPRDRRDPELARRRAELLDALHVPGVAAAAPPASGEASAGRGERVYEVVDGGGELAVPSTRQGRSIHPSARGVAR